MFSLAPLSDVIGRLESAASSRTPAHPIVKLKRESGVQP